MLSVFYRRICSTNATLFFAPALVFASVLLTAATANASSASGGYVQSLSIGADGSVWFVYTGTLHGSLPACADPNGLWIVDPTQAGRDAMLAALLSAQARHAIVDIQGNGDCYVDHERIAYLVVP